MLFSPKAYRDIIAAGDKLAQAQRAEQLVLEAASTKLSSALSSSKVSYQLSQSVTWRP